MAIKGMSEACEKFNTPVTGGNVSFYNQTVKEGSEAVPVFPTPTIGMIGLVNDLSKSMTLDFKTKGDLIFLIGESVTMLIVLLRKAVLSKLASIQINLRR